MQVWDAEKRILGLWRAGPVVVGFLDLHFLYGREVGAGDDLGADLGFDGDKLELGMLVKPSEIKCKPGSIKWSCFLPVQSLPKWEYRKLYPRCTKRAIEASEIGISEL